ncbi:uncharacterized protein LOC114295567 [Camellia sinensis]|uniref:uncharacterized protein LOC114295567 n=1 Tax=Camellia sinensis TaxID=4442 RepID=UPI001035914C|nr:uncharacterized protein LOC114295567 [Camellia sinensis]
MSSAESGRKDPAWKCSTMVNPRNLSKFKCNFCGKEMNGGVCRVKQHLVGGYRNVTKYFDDEDDLVELSQHGKKSILTQGSTQRTSSGSVQSKLKRPRKIGPMDCFFTPDPDVVAQKQKGKGKQSKIDENDPYRKELMQRAYVRIARWMYDSGIPFNAVNYDSFGPMIEAIGQFGPDLKPPTYHMIRVPYLKKEVGVNRLMKEHKDDWPKYGCSIMCDGWTDKRNMTLLNFLVNCPRGTMFIESIDASSYSKDGNKMFNFLDKFVEKIGEANVIQVVTDSTTANVLAGKFLEAKRPHLYWTPCAAHCLDLM